MQSYRLKIYLRGYDTHTGRHSREEAVDKVEKSGIYNYNVESNYHHEFRLGIYVSSWRSGEILGG